jgi:hypothetical protein
MPHDLCAFEMPNGCTAPALKDGYRASESLQNQGVSGDVHHAGEEKAAAVSPPL